LEIERNPMGLSKEDLTAVMRQWRKLHPVGSCDNNSSFPRKPLEEIYREQSPVYREVIGDVGRLLSTDSLAELMAIFSIGRDHEPPEQLHKITADYRSDLAATANLDSEIAKLLQKANFQTCVSAGLVMLGRSEMVSSLNAI
jgi:hypothetical protein